MLEKGCGQQREWAMSSAHGDLLAAPGAPGASPDPGQCKELDRQLSWRWLWKIMHLA